MSQNILITGATGFVGSRLTEFLATQPGGQVTATGRRINAGQLTIPPNVRFVAGDLSDRSFTDQLLTGVDVVVHAAALSSPWGDYADFHRANVIATENLLASAREAGVQRLVHISTPSIYFDGRDRFDIREEDPLPTRFVNHYANTKFLAEGLVRLSGLPYVILRPRAIIGRGDTVIMPRLIRARQENRLRVVGDGQNVVDLTSVSNLVDAIWLAINAPDSALGEAYNITNGQPVPLWPFVNQVLTQLRMPLGDASPGEASPGPKRIPYGLLYVLAGLSEVRARWLGGGREPALTRYGVGVLAKSCTLNIDKVRQRLGYTPRQTVEEAIEEFVNWYQKR